MIRITLIRSCFKCVLKLIPEKIDSQLLRIDIESTSLKKTINRKIEEKKNAQPYLKVF